MKYLTEWLSKSTGLPAEICGQMLISVIYILTIWFVRKIILHGVWSRTENPRIRYQWSKYSNYVAFAISVLVIGRIWLAEFQSVATFLGLVSAGLAIALKDPLVNIAGWLFIVWRRPFDVGDRIMIGAHAGDVIDIRVFQFTIMEIGSWVQADQSTGRIVHIPNGKIFTEPQTNYSKGWFDYIWNEIPVLITFESNWKKAKKILQQIATKQSDDLIPLAKEKLKSSSKDFIVLSPALDATVINSVEPSGVLLTIRNLCEPRNRRENTQNIWETVLEEFAACNDIELAYPTRRYVTGNDSLEQKSGEVTVHDPPGHE